MNERESASSPRVASQLLSENDTEAVHRKSYSSDLTDSQWHQINTFFDTHRYRQYDLRRDILDVVFHLAKTGCKWRMLPGGFAPWQTMYYYFRKWRRQGLVGRLLSTVRRKARQEAGREVEPSALVIDCQSVPNPRTGGLFGFEKLFGGCMRSRATVGDASKGRSNEPCSRSYRASAVGFLSEIHKGVSLRRSAKQPLTLTRKSRAANSTSSSTRRDGPVRSRCMRRMSMKVSGPLSSSNRPTRKATSWRWSSPMKPTEVTSKTNWLRRSASGWRSLSRANPSRTRPALPKLARLLVQKSGTHPHT